MARHDADVCTYVCMATSLAEVLEPASVFAELLLQHEDMTLHFLIVRSGQRARGVRPLGGLGFV